MQEEAIELLVDGVVNVMRHLGMIERRPNFEFQISKSKANKTARSAVATTKTTAADTAASTF